MTKLPKYLKNAHKQSVRSGWTWVLKGSGHVTVRNDKGDFVVCISLTAYDGTLTRKMTRTLQKAKCPGL